MTKPLSPADVYLLHQIATAPPEQLQSMLLSAAQRHLHRAATQFNTGDLQLQKQYVDKVVDIITTLSSYLSDEQTELTKSLYSIYRFWLLEIPKAFMSSDLKAIDAILMQMKELQIAWEMRQEAINRNNTQ